MRFALGVEYDGSGFSGWQRLSAAGSLVGDGSLQTALEIALSKVANARIDTVCAGRTDAGSIAILLPLDDDLPGRIEAIQRFWQMLKARPVPRDTRMTPYQRQRFRQMMQAAAGRAPPPPM